MSVEPNIPTLRGHSDLHLRPFAQRMAAEHPELWAKFVAACAREHVAESHLTPEEFIRRCTRATRRLIREHRARFAARRAA